MIDNYIELSVIVPVYKNEADIEGLIAAINSSIAGQIQRPFEVIFVVDGSPDRSRDLLFEVLRQQAWSSQLIVLSRNFGACSAIRTGMSSATGSTIVVLAADLQDPADLVPKLWNVVMQDEADIALGTRIARDDGFIAALISRSFWWSYRKLVTAEMPRGGVSIFAFNRRVKDAVLGLNTPNKSMLSQIMWVGFRRKFVPYVRRARRSGRSAYSFNRKLTYALDTLVSFSDLPITFQIWFGILGSVVWAGIGLVSLLAWCAGWIGPMGNMPIILLVTVGFSFLFLSHGILGLYLWKTFDNSKRLPLSVVSEHSHFPGIIRNENRM